MYNQIIESVKEWIMGRSDRASHDFYHSLRVYNNVCFIVKNEKIGDEIAAVAKISALLHDVGHKKKSYLVKDNHEYDGSVEVAELLHGYGVNHKMIDRVVFCVNNHRYSQNDSVGNDMLELRVLRDADRLDALGAIAIARTFSYDSERPIYLPDDAPKEKYDGISNTSINHIIEKILKLTPDAFYMEASRKMASERLEFVKMYVEEFFKEWDGIC